MHCRKNDDQAETVGELNDVLYHVTVLLCFSGVTLERAMADPEPPLSDGGTEL